MHPLLGDLYFSQDVGVNLYESNQDEQISMIAAVNVHVYKRKGVKRCGSLLYSSRRRKEDNPRIEGRKGYLMVFHQSSWLRQMMILQGSSLHAQWSKVRESSDFPWKGFLANECKWKVMHINNPIFIEIARKNDAHSSIKAVGFVCSAFTPVHSCQCSLFLNTQKNERKSNFNASLEGFGEGHR